MSVKNVSLQEILQKATEMRASDIHLTCGANVCFRVHGQIWQLDAALSDDAEDFLSAFAPFVDSEALTTWRAHRDADSGFDAGPLCPQYRFRFSGYWAAGCPAAAIRVISRTIPGPEACGLPPALKEQCLTLSGLILLTGPSGSGKSTTMASLVQWLAEQKSLHIVTLEDPVEYIYDSEVSLIHQRQTGRDLSDFADGVRSALRTDADVICIGELRDAQTISAALTAAETGHLVLATVHAPDASRAVDRIIDSFPAAAQTQARAFLAMTLRAVCAQRLIPSADGRAAAFELMIATPAVQNAIREGKTAQLKNLIQTGAREGMQSFEASLARLASSGRISAAQAAQWAQDRGEFLRRLEREGERR